MRKHIAMVMTVAPFDRFSNLAYSTGLPGKCQGNLSHFKKTVSIINILLAFVREIGDFHKKLFLLKKRFTNGEKGDILHT